MHFRVNDKVRTDGDEGIVQAVSEHGLSILIGGQGVPRWVGANSGSENVLLERNGIKFVDGRPVGGALDVSAAERRERIAVAAMQGIISNSELNLPANEAIAKSAIKMADELIKQLDEPTNDS